MRDAPSGPYRYQPYGPVSHPERVESGRFYAVTGLVGLSSGELRGLTNDEAGAIVRILTSGPQGGPGEPDVRSSYRCADHAEGGAPMICEVCSKPASHTHHQAASAMPAVVTER